MRQKNPLTVVLYPSQFYAFDLAGFIVRDPDGSMWIEVPGWVHCRAVIASKL